MSNVLYVTKEWLLKLEEELVWLKNTRRIEIAEKLKEAISFWDLSENSEYEDARNEQAQVEKRIIDLEAQLKNIEIIEESEGGNKITIGTQVKFIDVEKKEEFTVKIVGTTETNILEELPKISNESPIWAALIWKKKWDKVKVKSQSGTIEYKILEIN